MGPLKCCVGGCTATSESHRLYSFPKNDYLRNLWMSYLVPSNRLLIALSKGQLLKKRVCEKHFDKYQFDYNGQRLRFSYPCLISDKEITHGIPLFARDIKDSSNEHNYAKPYPCKDEITEHSLMVAHAESSVHENNESANTTNLTTQSGGNNDKNTTSKLINRRISCDTTDSVKLGISEDPLAIESDEAADHTVSDAEYLEDIDEEISEWSDGIFDEYAQKWEAILKNGLGKTVQDEINSNYLFCENLPSSKPPILNTEIANLLTEEIKIRDQELVNKQSQLGHALAALGMAMTGLRTNTMEASDILETLNDVGDLIADLHYLETEARRSLIVQELDKSFAEPLQDQLRDEYLFGQDVGELLKPPEVKTTASSITPRMISTFLNKKKMKRPAALTPMDRITKKPRQCIETSLTSLRTREEHLSSDTGTAAPDPDPDQTTTDPTAALSQLNNIQVYGDNCQQPQLPRQRSMPLLTNGIEFPKGDYEDEDTGIEEICTVLLEEVSVT